MSSRLLSGSTALHKKFGWSTQVQFSMQDGAGVALLSAWSPHINVQVVEREYRSSVLY